jgi:hypothetical protein
LDQLEEHMSSARTRLTRAFTRTELLVTVACLALFAAILLPAFEKEKAKAIRIACISRLKNVGISFRIWSTDSTDRLPMQVSVTNGGTMEWTTNGSVVPHFLAISNGLSTPKILICPADRTRRAAATFSSSLTETNISYFLNLDAREDFPSAVMSGDRNLTNIPSAGSRWVNITTNSTIGWNKEMHSEAGNVVRGDGSASQFTNGSARAVIEVPDGTTNRLAIP